MTIVCAITDGEATWIGSDRQVTTGGDMAVQLREGKWIETPSGWWVGHSGWGRLTNLIETCVERSYDPHGLAKTLRERMLADGWVPIEDGDGPRQHNGRIILARAGEIWTVDSSGAVLRCPDHELAAVGDGDGVAAGAAHGYRWGKGGRADFADLVLVAVLAAIRYSAGCGMGEWTKELR
jgi:ATP-dependent protease HslVU (ClpYQ) peptidase subunit